MMLIDADGIIRFVNHGIGVLFGHECEELLGRPVGRLIPGLEPGDAVTPGAAASSAELPGVHRDGSRLLLDVALATVVGLDGALLVTATVRMRGQGERREARFQDLLDSTPDAMIVVGPDGVIELVNRQAESLFGYAREELAGRPVEMLVPEPARGRHPSHRSDYAQDGLTRPMGAGLQLLARRKDGTEIPVDIALATLPGVGAGGPSVITTIRDVTERRAAERRLQALLDSAPDAMVIVDRDGRIDAVNRQTELLFGWTAADLVGKAVEVLIPDRFRAVHPGHRTRYTSAPATRPMGAGLELLGRRQDGSEFPAEISLSAIPDGAGGLQVTAAVRDVTRRSELEAELRRSIDLADAANAAKSEFLSRMSHELRTPLNAVLGFAQLLELDELNGEQRDSVDQITRAGQHLLELINEVLDIARIESGQLSMANEPVPLGAVVDEVTDMLAPFAHEHRVALGRNNPDGSSPFVRSDRQRLRQILLNIVTNAVKYNRPGGRADIEWFVESGREAAADASSAWVCLRVRDTGRGIAREDLHRLFEPFDRLGAEQTDIEGSGIGMAVTRRLVQAMGGEIDVVSRPGTGTTVSVWLPHVPGGGADRAPDGSDEPNARRTALYIEDNLSDLRLMEHVFARCPGWQLVHALHGSLGLVLARSHRPDLILLDLGLPDLDGTVVMDQLKHDPSTAGIPVVVVTADATREQRAQLERAGINGLVPKPVSVTRILQVVERFPVSAPGG